MLLKVIWYNHVLPTLSISQKPNKDSYMGISISIYSIAQERFLNRWSLMFACPQRQLTSQEIALKGSQESSREILQKVRNSALQSVYVFVTEFNILSPFVLWDCIKEIIIRTDSFVFERYFLGKIKKYEELHHYYMRLHVILLRCAKLPSNINERKSQIHSQTRKNKKGTITSI